jgi:hypothetical protein
LIVKANKLAVEGGNLFLTSKYICNKVYYLGVLIKPDNWGEIDIVLSLVSVKKGSSV